MGDRISFMKQMIISISKYCSCLHFHSKSMREFIGILYRNIVRPTLFCIPADIVHEFFLKSGRVIGKIGIAKRLLRIMLRYENPILEQSYFNLHFKNPIGLSAGFDYNADLVRILSHIGFGFHTVGTLTLGAYGGNPPPLLGRLPQSRSLLVNKGFKNEGIVKVLKSMDTEAHEAPRGVSIGATNTPYLDFDAMMDNLIAGFQEAERFDNFDYYELNISCPNLLNIQNLKLQLASPEGLG